MSVTFHDVRSLTEADSKIQKDTEVRQTHIMQSPQADLNEM